MTAPISRPVSPGNPSHGFAWKAVVVLSLDTSRRVATCVDDFGKYMDIRCDIMRAKGNLPERNEQWLVTREFGIWTFAAIINGTTRGVEVSNVTDLPEEIDRIDGVSAAIRQDTLGKIVGKGDLLLGVSAGQVVRMPVGNLNESLVADPNSSTGVAYKDVTGRPAGFVGVAPAIAAGRWVGTTAFGAPTSGTWAVGDWVSTQTGYRWVCTVAGSPGTWVERTNAVENRATALESRAGLNEVRGRHIWTLANPALAAGQDLTTAGYSTFVNDGIASLTSSGLFFFNRQGRWSISAEVASDGSRLGRQDVYILFGNPNPTGSVNGTIGDSRHRVVPNVAGGGYLRQFLAWTGWVTPAEAGIPFTVHTAWYSGSGPNDYNNLTVRMDYLGPF